jgi:hypothetical protein
LTLTHLHTKHTLMHKRMHTLSYINARTFMVHTRTPHTHTHETHTPPHRCRHSKKLAGTGSVFFWSSMVVDLLRYAELPYQWRWSFYWIEYWRCATDAYWIESRYSSWLVSFQCADGSVFFWWSSLVVDLLLLQCGVTAVYGPWYFTAILSPWRGSSQANTSHGDHTQMISLIR